MRGAKWEVEALVVRRTMLMVSTRGTTTSQRVPEPASQRVRLQQARVGELINSVKLGKRHFFLRVEFGPGRSVHPSRLL